MVLVSNFCFFLLLTVSKNLGFSVKDFGILFSGRTRDRNSVRRLQQPQSKLNPNYSVTKTTETCLSWTTMPSLSNFVWLFVRPRTRYCCSCPYWDRVHTATMWSRCKGYGLSQETLWILGITAHVLSLSAAWHHRALKRLLWQKCYFRITRNATIDIVTRGMVNLVFFYPKCR
jgi:hypothetical protein